MRRRTVREIMSSGEIQALPSGASVREALGVMARQNVSSVLVVEGSRLLGIFTERDAVRRVLCPRLDPDHTLLAEVMTWEPDTIAPGDLVQNVIRRMDEFGYRHLPVVDDGRLVGMVSLRDCPIDDVASMAAELETRRAVAERAW